MSQPNVYVYTPPHNKSKRNDDEYKQQHRQLHNNVPASLFKMLHHEDNNHTCEEKQRFRRVSNKVRGSLFKMVENMTQSRFVESMCRFSAIDPDVHIKSRDCLFRRLFGAQMTDWMFAHARKYTPVMSLFYTISCVLGLISLFLPKHVGVITIPIVVILALPCLTFYSVVLNIPIIIYLLKVSFVAWYLMVQVVLFGLLLILLFEPSDPRGWLLSIFFVWNFGLCVVIDSLPNPKKATRFTPLNTALSMNTLYSIVMAVGFLFGWLTVTKNPSISIGALETSVVELALSRMIRLIVFNAKIFVTRVHHPLCFAVIRGKVGLDVLESTRQLRRLQTLSRLESSVKRKKRPSISASMSMSMVVNECAATPNLTPEKRLTSIGKRHSLRSTTPPPPSSSSSSSSVVITMKPHNNDNDNSRTGKHNHREESQTRLPKHMRGKTLELPPRPPAINPLSNNVSPLAKLHYANKVRSPSISEVPSSMTRTIRATSSAEPSPSGMFLEVDNNLEMHIQDLWSLQAVPYTRLFSIRDTILSRCWSKNIGHMLFDLMEKYQPILFLLWCGSVACVWIGTFLVPIYELSGTLLLSLSFCGYPFIIANILNTPVAVMRQLLRQFEISFLIAAILLLLISVMDMFRFDYRVVAPLLGSGSLLTFLFTFLHGHKTIVGYYLMLLFTCGGVVSLVGMIICVTLDWFPDVRIRSYSIGQLRTNSVGMVVSTCITIIVFLIRIIFNVLTFPDYFPLIDCLIHLEKPKTRPYSTSMPMAY